MIETVVALCMFVAGELKEHRIQPAMSDCLKGKRLAERDKSDTVNYKCGKVKVELENNIDGSKSIKKIVEE
jgi:membrane-bound inhibitor of C-type lysozyme